MVYSTRLSQTTISLPGSGGRIYLGYYEEDNGIHYVSHSPREDSVDFTVNRADRGENNDSDSESEHFEIFLKKLKNARENIELKATPQVSNDPQLEGARKTHHCVHKTRKMVISSQMIHTIKSA